MTKPSAGGRYIRDAKTRKLTRVDDDAATKQKPTAKPEKPAAAAKE